MSSVLISRANKGESSGASPNQSTGVPVVRRPTFLIATTAAKPMHSKITVTGCLQKGDSADEFAIAGKNGKTWELRSQTVKLDEHVGHTVTITGVRHHETKGEEAKEEKTETKESKKAEAMEAGDLRVTSLKMVSDSCKK